MGYQLELKSSTTRVDACYLLKGFARDYSRSVLLTFSQSYVKHDLKKKKIL